MPDPVVSNAPDTPDALANQSIEVLHPGLSAGVDTGAGVMLPDDPSAINFLQAEVPQPAPVSQSPATQSQAPAQAPAAAEPPQSSGGRLFAGKYRSVEEMERGYREQQKVLDARSEENRILKAAQLAAERIGGFRREREDLTPAPPAHIPVTFQGDQPVVPVSDLRTEIIAAAQAAARETVSGILTPMQRLGEANNTVRSSYPEFSQQEAAFTGWLRDNPRYQELIQHDPEVGLESAYLKYRNDTGVQQVSAAHQTAIAAQQQVEQARSQAAPAGGAGAASRRPTEQESRLGDLERLHKRWQETGDIKAKDAYVKARIAYGLGDGFLNTLNQTQWGR